MKVLALAVILAVWSNGCSGYDSQSEISGDIHQSAAEGDLEEVKRLVDAGIDVNRGNRYGELPIHMACYSNRLAIVKYLVENGAALHTDHGADPLHIAVNLNNVDTALYLLAVGADPYRKTAEGQTAFDLAVDERVREAILRISPSR